MAKQTSPKPSGKLPGKRQNRASGQQSPAQNSNYQAESIPRPLLKQFIDKFRPKNIYHYWFSRSGALAALKTIGFGAVLLFLLLVGLLTYYRSNMAAAQGLYGKNFYGSIQFYDRTGKVLLWDDRGAVNRIPISGSQMPALIRDATVAIEDKDFYHEGAVNFGSILRAALHDIFNPGSALQGGSTITEQLVKLNQGWIGNMSISRKIKEMAMAYNLGEKYSKPDILTAYLNSVPYGGTDYGIDTAANDYFRVSPDQLSLAQAAMLAAIPESPSYYSPRSPYFNAAALKGREDYILTLMQQQGYISKAQEASAKQTNVLAEVQPPENQYGGVIAPYFDLAAQEQLQQQFGPLLDKGGSLKVITTLNLNQQTEAQKLVADNLAGVEADGGDDEALVTENVPTGQVTSLVGGTDFNNPDYGQINYAVTPINPGSSYKLYDYTALLNDKNNVGAGSVLYDSKGPLPGYPCTNQAVPGGNCLYDYDYQYPGPLTLRYALAGSRNVPAVKAMLLTGEQQTINLSKAMGLTSGYNCYANAAETQTTKCYDSAAIGYGYLSLDQSVNGYATDARLGNYVPQTFILKIINASGNTVYRWQQPPPQQVVKPDAAYIVDNMLDDPGASYLPGSCDANNCTPMSDFGFKFQHTNGWDVAVKTGTTNQDNSGLMMAMTTQYSVGSWVGYHTADQPLTPHYGGLEGVTEPLTRGMIDYLTANQQPINWVRPSDIKKLPAYVVNNPPTGTQGKYYGWQYPSPSTDLYPSWYSGPVKRSTHVCNARAFSIDTFVSGSAAAAYTCNQTNNISNNTLLGAAPGINIDSVQCGSLSSCEVTVTVTTGSGAAPGNSPPGGQISILENGQVVTTANLPPGGGNYTATIAVNYVPGTTVFTAKLVSGSQTTESPPIILNPG